MENFILKKSKLLLEDKTEGTFIKKMDFERVDAVFDTLHWAFHPNGVNDEENSLDERCTAFWKLFLVTVGWTEDEFWKEYNAKPHDCPECGESCEDGEDEDFRPDDLNKSITESKPN